jgi:hypothetical protein
MVAVTAGLRGAVVTPYAVALREWQRTLGLPEAVSIPPGVWAAVTAPWRAAAAGRWRHIRQGISWPVPAGQPAVHLPGREVPAAPGTAIGDLYVLLSPGSNDEAKLAALERTVDRIRWVPRDARVRHTLATLATRGAAMEVVKRQELRAAVYLVLAERRRPQAHRFGRAWLTGRDGRQVPAVPEDLPLPLFWRWFADEVRKAAEASLRGESYPPATSETPATSAMPGPSAAPAHPGGAPRRATRRVISLGGAALEGLPDPAPEPLQLLIAAEEQREAAECWRAALRVATPRQRELLQTLTRLVRTRPPEAPPPTLADAARHLGLAPSTARVQWKRLLQRLRLDRRGRW